MQFEFVTLDLLIICQSMNKLDFFSFLCQFFSWHWKVECYVISWSFFNFNQHNVCILSSKILYLIDWWLLKISNCLFDLIVVRLLHLYLFSVIFLLSFGYVTLFLVSGITIWSYLSSCLQHYLRFTKHFALLHRQLLKHQGKMLIFFKFLYEWFPIDWEFALLHVQQGF